MRRSSCCTDRSASNKSPHSTSEMRLLGECYAASAVEEGCNFPTHQSSDGSSSDRKVKGKIPYGEERENPSIEEVRAIGRHVFFAFNATQTTKEIAHAKGWLKNIEEVLREKEELLPIRILKAVPFFGKSFSTEDFLPATGTQQFNLESLQLNVPGFKRFAGTFTEGQAYK
ncbi:hypothetical protein SK128_017109 [Halocaridina rubra]|uniref:Uncharacterized protein n=1 Tax=Halocaridina rubra TaxID=373956 RepID=A0AAN8WGG3_HALRR